LYSLHKITVSVLFVFLFPALFAGDPYRIPAGAVESGMASVCITKNGFWPSFQNQALLAFNNFLSAGINYENRFNISELGTRTAGVIIPAGNSSLGFVYSNFGYNHFRRETAGVSCGLTLSGKIAAGVQIDYFSEKTSSEYYRRHSVTCEAGLLILPDDNLSLGIHIFNPVPNSLRKSFLPTTLRAGAGIKLNKVLFAGAEAEMSTGKTLIIRTGFEYEVMKSLWLRGGFCSDNTSFTFGLGYLLNSLQLDFAFATHEKLGITSSASLIFKIH